MVLDASMIARNHLHKLEEDTSVLINMENALSSVIAWWTGIGMTHSTQETSSRMNLESFNTIRQKSTVKRWTNLKMKYVAYCTKVVRSQVTVSTTLLKINDDM